MDKEILNVFNLISQLKTFNFTEKKKDDEFYMKSYYIQIKGIISYKKWKEIVTEYSIETGEDIFDACEMLQPLIYEKYKK